MPIHNDQSEVRSFVTAPDTYTIPGSTIEGTPINRIILDVFNQPIFWQMKRAIGGGSGGNWDDVETPMSPGSRVIVRRGIVGFRFRAFTKAANLPAGVTQAVVNVEAVK